MTTPKYKIMTIEKYEKLMKSYWLSHCAKCDWNIDNHKSQYAGGYDNEMCVMRETCGKHFCMDCAKTQMKRFENPIIDGEEAEEGDYCVGCIKEHNVKEGDDEDDDDEEDEE